MASKYTKEELDKVLLLVLEDGVKIAEARKIAGVKNHSAAELHAFEFEWYCAELNGEVGPRGEGEWSLTPELADYLRRFAPSPDGGEKLGWAVGRIMVATKSGEAKVRKAFREGSKLDDRGIRIGKGGAFLNRDPLLYEGSLKASGTEIPEGERPNARKHAKIQRLMKLDFAELKRQAQEAGIEVKRGTTPARLAKLLADA